MQCRSSKSPADYAKNTFIKWDLLEKTYASKCFY